MRLYINYTATYFNSKDRADGMEQLYNALSLTGDVVYNCYEAFNVSLNLGTGGFTWSDILVNVLNNVGYMYTDVVNVATSNSTT